MRTIKEMIDLHGRIALITGGAGHIGEAIGEALAELGAWISVLDLRLEDCQRACDQIKSQFGVEALPVAADLSNESNLKSSVDRTLDHFGRLDILVNCAALVGTSELKGWGVPFLQQSSQAWKLALDVNLTGPFLLSQFCAEALQASGHGSIINVGSIYGMVGPNWNLYTDTSMGNPAAYGASKGGLLQLTRYIATALAPQIRVNMLTPGGVYRGQPEIFLDRYKIGTPLQRMANEEDFKGAAAYLASDLSAYVTGQNLVVDGGWTIW